MAQLRHAVVIYGADTVSKMSLVEDIDWPIYKMRVKQTQAGCVQCCFGFAGNDGDK